MRSETGDGIFCKTTRVLVSSILMASTSTFSAEMDPKPAALQNIGECFLVAKRGLELEPEENAGNIIEPSLALKNYFRGHGVTPPHDAETVSIVSKPIHGRLVAQGDGSYIYAPAINYVGRDLVKFSVALGGEKYILHVEIHVLPTAIGNDTYREKCGSKGLSWRIS